jgi:beta-N-acetylhexosaminidase
LKNRGDKEVRPVEQLTLEEKIGQVFMFGFPGKDPEDAHYLIRNFKPAGIIYFARNCGTVEETAMLSAQLQEWARNSSPGIPLFIAADQEGGVVARLTQGIPVMPGPMSLAAAVAGGDDKFIEEASYATAIQLRSAGINLNAAPVLDVNDNPENPIIGIRSFGEDPELVARYGVLAAEGYRRGGVIATGKHFPGHGNTSVDSHLDLPVLPHSMERLNSCELVPFKKAIKAGIPAIMTAHIVFQAIDSQKPATLSNAVLRGLLRDTLGFQGAIMTDCLEMNAISKHPGTARGAVEAFKAGCDLLLISHTREFQEQAWAGLLEAVKSGEVSEKRLDESVNRVLDLKRAFQIPNPVPAGNAYDPRFEELFHELHLRSITLVKNDKNLLPLVPPDGRKMRLCLAATMPKRLLQVEDDPLKQQSAVAETGPRTGLGKSLLSLCSTLKIDEIDIDGPDALETCLTLADKADATIILTQDAVKNPFQAKFAQKVIEAVPNALLIATRSPYDIRVIPAAHTYLCTYSSRPETMRALAHVLTGKRAPSGKLPVTIPGLSLN